MTASLTMGIGFVFLNSRRFLSPQKLPIDLEDWIKKLIEKDSESIVRGNIKISKNIYGIYTLGEYLIVNDRLNNDIRP